ncbi:MAG: hypothetical protein AAGB22_10140, partial [Bacteroidota bacterium]
MKSFLSVWVALLAFALSGYAQNGPGGVSSANLEFWFRADAAAFTDAGTTEATDGQSVQQWNDQSGNGNNLSQPTSSNRPTLQTGVVNGQPVMRFDGSDDAFSEITVSAVSAPAEIFAVLSFANLTQPSGNFDYVMNLGGINGANTNISISRRPVTQRYFSFDGASLRNGVILTGQTFQIFNPKHATSSTFHSLDIDGNSQSVSDYSGSVSTNGNLRVGHDPNGNNEFDGDLGELFLFTAALNTAEQNLVENYLSSKYGIGIPSANDFYAHDAANGNDVAGIGRDDASNQNGDARGSGVVRINSATSLGDGDYLLFGHDGQDLSQTQTSDVPADYTANMGTRLRREWRVDETGDVGTVSIIFDLSGGNAFSNDPNNYELLIDSDGTFATGATRHTTGLSWDAGNNTLTFTGVDFSDGDFFTLGNTNESTTITSIANGGWTTDAT